MPRTARILVDEGYYHIVTRGIDRRKLFRYRQDYNYFLEITKKYLVKFKIQILNYCLMSNHIHLLIRAEEAEDLPKFMQAVLQVYASYFRKKYHSHWSSFSFYAGGIGDGIIKIVNPLYLELAKTEPERQQRYINYVSEERPYEHIVDKEFKLR